MIKFHFTKIVLFMFSTAIIAGNSNYGAVNILPTPKKIEIADKRFVLDAQNSVIMIDKNAGKESFLGAEEINKKIKELNGNALPVKKESELSSAELKEKNLIILGMVNSDLIIPFKKYFNVAVSFNSFNTKNRKRKSIINLKKSSDKAADVKKNGNRRIARCAIQPFAIIK